MRSKGQSLNPLTELRQRAESASSDGITSSPSNKNPIAEQNVLRAYHELSVHQIELEMQNEELQKALAEVETVRERYLDLYDLAPVGYLTLSESGLIMEANLTAAGMLGVTRGSLINQPLSRYILTEYKDLYYQHCKQLFATGEQQSWDLRMVKKEGPASWFNMQAMIARDPDGAPMSRLVMSDITERKKAEEALHESEERFRLEESQQESKRQLRTLIDTLPDLVWLKDHQGVYLACNHRFELFFGANEQEIIGKTDYDFVDEGLANFFREKDQIAMTAGKPTSNEERITFSCDGHQEDLETIKTPIFDINGGISGILGIGRNITLRKQAEESLRESEAQFRRYVEQSPIGIFECDRRGRYLQVNPAASRITGYSPEELLELSIPDILPPESKDFALGLFQKLLETGHCFGDFAFKHKSGRLCHCAVQGVRLSPARFLCFASDITERKLAEEQQRHIEAQLQQAQKMESLGVLVAGVAHNFNHILTLIMGTASVREQRVGEPSDLEAYKTIGQICKRGREMVKSLMQFAQPTISNEAPIELHTLMREVCALLEHTTSKRVKIIESFAIEPLWINGDAGSINQVLVNLCVNSMDAMPKGGMLTLGTTIHEDDWVEVSVMDTGWGMTTDVLAHVLEPFFTTKEVGKGTGLGLSMTHGTVKAHGGTMSISSQPGLGTTVKLRFPRIPAPAQSETVKPPSLSVPLDSMKVLLVDDEESVRSLVTLMLKEAGVHQVKAFSGGKKALESLRAGELPDIVILDQNMPGMDGIQAMMEIRKLHPDLPILIASGQPGIEQWECFRQPRLGVITKPFSVEEIQAKLGHFACQPNTGQ